MVIEFHTFFFTIFVLHWIVGLICSFIFWQWWCFFKTVAECCFRVDVQIGYWWFVRHFRSSSEATKFYFYFFLWKKIILVAFPDLKKNLWKWYILEYFVTLKYQMLDNILCILNMVTKYFVGNVTSFLHRYKQNWNNI